MEIEYRAAEKPTPDYEDVILRGRNIGRMYLEPDGTFQAQIIPSYYVFGVTGFGNGSTREEAIRNALLVADGEIESSIKGVAWIREMLGIEQEIAA